MTVQTFDGKSTDWRDIEGALTQAEIAALAELDGDESDLHSPPDLALNELVPLVNWREEPYHQRPYGVLKRHITDVDARRLARERKNREDTIRAAVQARLHKEAAERSAYADERTKERTEESRQRVIDALINRRKKDLEQMKRTGFSFVIRGNNVR